MGGQLGWVSVVQKKMSVFTFCIKVVELTKINPSKAIRLFSMMKLSWWNETDKGASN